MYRFYLPLVLFGASTPAFCYEIINNETAYLNIYSEIKARAFIYENRSNQYTFGDSKLGVDARYALTDTTRLLSLVEGEVNWDADEDIGQDDLYFSRAYVGVQHELIGLLTFGQHATASDDIEGVDYSVAFGGKANLNPVNRHDKGIKYRYSSDFFMIDAMYGEDGGDLKRDVIELFGYFNITEEYRVKAGVGNATTNITTNKKEDDYALFGFEAGHGDIFYGANYYYNNSEDKITTINDVTRHGFAAAISMELVEKLFGFTGYEVVKQKSDNSNLDGTLNNIYLGSKYRFTDWLDVFAEVSLFDDDTRDTNESEFNFALGATMRF